ncbi:adenylate/guanylate cyclase domain-containing protein, partial [Cribrihabitans sp. XS_ASV171]
LAIHHASAPFAFRLLGRSAGAMIITVSACLLFYLVSHFLGSGAGIFLFLLVVPAALLVVLGPRWKGTVFSGTFLCAATIVAILVLTDEPALTAASDPVFQTVLMTLAVFGTAFLSIAVAYVAFQQAESAEDALEAEHARSEALLYNLLPEEIAARLKRDPDATIADSLPRVAILFADIVDFTPRAATLPPEEVVGFLNRVFRAFDALAEKHGLEKIKTIGDAYMVAAGMPTPCDAPVHRVAEMALEMLEATRKLSAEVPDGLQVRIGLHSGPAVAGVIGNRKLFYDVWGETVNTASRMESHGAPGRIQVTGAARAELGDDYRFERRGTVEVKGMGAVETWWLTGRA